MKVQVQSVQERGINNDKAANVFTIYHWLHGMLFGLEGQSMMMAMIGETNRTLAT